MTGLPHEHLADELMLQALESSPSRDGPERDRLMLAADVQASLALAQGLAMVAAALAAGTSTMAMDPALLVLDEARRRRHRGRRAANSAGG